MVYIGLTGLNAAGKGTVSDYFVNKGFIYYSLSDIVREKATALGLDHSRTSLIHCGNLLRHELGSAALAKVITERISQDPDKDYIIDSIRNLSEIEELRTLKNFHLIGVDAPVKLRFARSKTRGRASFENTLEDFISVELKENSSDPKKQQLLECMKAADITIHNDKGIKELNFALGSLMSTLKK